MQFRPKHLLSQMAKHNVAPDASQEASIRSHCDVQSGKAVASRAPAARRASQDSPPQVKPARRRLDPFSIFWKMIIRPPRAEYELDELGPKAFRIPGFEGTYSREDIQLDSSRGERLECSYFKSICSHPEHRQPCVVYLHGNCSSRVEALDVLDELLPRGFSVFCFDFAGSGHSEGEYVTLGHNEEQDLKVVLDFLRDSKGVGPIALWGRSMGAATSILRAAEDHTLAACILDSSFGSLPDVARELTQSTKLKMPEVMVGAMLKRVRTEIKSRADVDIEELKPIEFAPRATAPALFAVAKDDEFVKAHHTYALHDAWGGEDRELVTLGGGHNSARPREFHTHAAEFLQERCRRLQLAEKPALPESQMQVVCQFSDVSSTMSTRAPSRVSSQELPCPTSISPEAPAPEQTPPAGAAAGRAPELPVTCRAALARARPRLGSCLDGCLAGVAAGIAAASPAAC